VARASVGLVLGNRYRLRRPVRSASAGQVWEAEDIIGHYLVDVEILTADPAGDPRRRARLLQALEALKWPRFVNPGAPLILDLEDEGDPRFVVMEAVRGETVAERVQRLGPLDLKEATRIVARVAAVLAEAHRVGVSHGELDPSSVILTDGGGVKLLDLGLTQPMWERRRSAPEDEARPNGGTVDLTVLERDAELSDVALLGQLLLDLVAGIAFPTPDAKDPNSSPPPLRPLVQLQDVAPEAPGSLARVCDWALGAAHQGQSRTAAQMAWLLHSIAEMGDPGGGSNQLILDLDRFAEAAPEPPVSDPEAESSAGTAVQDSVAESLETDFERRRRVVKSVLTLALAAALISAPLLAAVALRRSPTPPVGTLTARPIPTSTGTLDSSARLIAVPDVRGLTVTEARAKIVAAGLQLVGLIPVRGGEVGHVKGSEPPPGTLMHPRDGIRLQVSVLPSRLSSPSAGRMLGGGDLEEGQPL
jgi:serine/threonine protein kinase